MKNHSQCSVATDNISKPEIVFREDNLPKAHKAGIKTKQQDIKTHPANISTYPAHIIFHPAIIFLMRQILLSIRH